MYEAGEPDLGNQLPHQGPDSFAATKPVLVRGPLEELLSCSDWGEVDSWLLWIFLL